MSVVRHNEEETKRRWTNNPEQRNIVYYYPHAWNTSEAYAALNYAIGTTFTGDTGDDKRVVMGWQIERQRDTNQCWIVVTWANLVHRYAKVNEQFGPRMTEMWETIDATPDATIEAAYPLGKLASGESGWNGMKVTDHHVNRNLHSNKASIIVNYKGLHAFEDA